MKPTNAGIALCVFSACWINCRGQISTVNDVSSPRSAASAQTTSNPGQRCPVAGTVMSATTGAPLNKAFVRLSRLAEGSDSFVLGSYAAASDSSGRFQAMVEAGRYALSVTRNGYAKQTAGIAGIQNQATSVTVACTDVVELRFFMTPQGVITGTVVDEDNEPVANAVVEAFSYRVVSPENRARVAGSARTDDQGRYRIFGISAGRYYVSARLQENSANGAIQLQEEQQTRSAPAYYPGTSRAAAAVPIQIISGQENKADITMAKVPTVRASGRLLADYRVGRASLLAYEGDHPSWDPGGRHFAEVDAKTGRWTIQGLQPGPYTVVCDRIDGGIRMGARLPLNVGTRNIENLEMTMTRYPDLAGKVVVEGGGAVPPGLKVLLQPRQALASMGYGSAQLNAEGGFFLQATSPDLSDIAVTGLPSGYFVKSVMFSGRDVSETGIELGLGGSHMVSIVLSSRGAVVQGTVADAQDKPCRGATVVLVPDMAQRELRSRYYVAKSDQDGGFTISGVRAGEYTIVAWDSAASIDYMDPDALEAADKQGQTLKLEGGERHTMQLKVGSTAGLLP